MLKNKAQTWSFDVIIAITVFIIAFVFFYGIISYAGVKPDAQQLVDQGNLIVKTLSSGDSSVIVNNKLNKDNLESFAALTEEQQKDYLGVSEDFCIYFETDNGSVIEIIKNEIGENERGIGSKNIEIGNRPCYATDEII